MDTCIHERPELRCSQCLPKRAWPQGWHPCSCKVLIPRYRGMCDGCVEFHKAEAINPQASRRHRYMMARIARTGVFSG